MVGIDIVFVPRIKEKLDNEKFFDKILTSVEKKYILLKKSANKDVEAKSLAGFFAVKEAVLKAFGVGITNGYGFQDITIDHNEFGAPIVLLSEKLQNLLKEKHKNEINVSISHDGEYATAIAIIN